MWRVADTNDSRRPELSGASIAWGGNASDRAAEFMRGGDDENVDATALRSVFFSCVQCLLL